MVGVFREEEDDDWCVLKLFVQNIFCVGFKWLFCVLECSPWTLFPDEGEGWWLEPITENEPTFNIGSPYWTNDIAMTVLSEHSNFNSSPSQACTWKVRNVPDSSAGWRYEWEKNKYVSSGEKSSKPRAMDLKRENSQHSRLVMCLTQTAREDKILRERVDTWRDFVGS